MKTRYSKTTGNFYPLNIDYPSFPEDLIEVEQADFEAAMARPAGHSFDFVDGQLVISAPPALTIAQQQQANVQAIQAELDRQAQARGYDTIVSACSYAAQAQGEPFQAEGAAFLAWRSLVWKHAYDVLQQVESGAVPMPTPAEAVAMMPALALP